MNLYVLYTFKPSDSNRSSEYERKQQAHYNNAIYYQDYVLDEILTRLEEEEAIVLYLSDHGDEVFDGKNSHVQGHSEDKVTTFMMEVPFFFFFTSKFEEKFPEEVKRIKRAVNRPFMTDDLIHTILDILQIHPVQYNHKYSVVNDDYDINRKRYIRKLLYSFDGRHGKLTRS